MSLTKQDSTEMKKPPPPHFHRHDNASIMIEAESQNESHRYREERDQEEYYYVHSRPQSEASESATMHFLTDDRIENHQQSNENYHSHQNYQVFLKFINNISVFKFFTTFKGVQRARTNFLTIKFREIPRRKLLFF